MLDIFLTTGAHGRDLIRCALWQAVLRWWRRWESRKLCTIHIYDASERPDSQMFRHVHAATSTTTDPYIVADDDILPMDTTDFGQPWHEYILSLMANWPRYGLLGATILPMAGLWPQVGREVLPAAAVGGLRIVRRGAVLPWKLPPLPEGQKTYDVELCDHVEGMCGVTTRWQALHLGWTWPPKPGGDLQKLWQGMGCDRPPSPSESAPPSDSTSERSRHP